MVRADVFNRFFGSFCLAQRGDTKPLEKFSLVPGVGIEPTT